MIHFIGTVKGAQGGVLHLSIAHAGSSVFDRSYAKSFGEPLDLAAGTYTVSMSAATPGTFIFDISGVYTNVDPQVPENFNNTMRVYELVV
jgi:hypothetical protein